MRWMLDRFTREQWQGIYAQAYANLAQGGWIEHIEPEVVDSCDDGTLQPDFALAKMGTTLPQNGRSANVHSPSFTPCVTALKPPVLPISRAMCTKFQFADGLRTHYIRKRIR